MQLNQYDTFIFSRSFIGSNQGLVVVPGYKGTLQTDGAGLDRQIRAPGASGQFGR